MNNISRRAFSLWFLIAVSLVAVLLLLICELLTKVWPEHRLLLCGFLYVLGVLSSVCSFIGFAKMYNKDNGEEMLEGLKQAATGTIASIVFQVVAVIEFFI